MDTPDNYSTEAFLGALKRFVSIRGYPNITHCDNGSQLVAANKKLREIGKGLDVNAIYKFGGKERVQWSFNKSGDAPWLNGACESLIRLVKNGISKFVVDSILTFSELQCMKWLTC